MFLSECADFPDSWSDRMGPDDCLSELQYELRRAAVRICEACPVRPMPRVRHHGQDQYGISADCR